MIDRLRICSALLVGASATALVASQPSGDAAGSGLTTAKQQLETIETSPTLSPAGGIVPRASLPTLDATPPAPEAPKSLSRAQKLELEKRQKAAAKEKNWLIEGMKERQQTSDTSGEKRALPASENPFEGEETTLLSNALAEGNSQEGKGGRRATEGKETEARTPEAVVNPLNGYMAAWMSARDFQLLQPAAAGGSTGAAEVTLQFSANVDASLPPAIGTSRTNFSPVTPLSAGSSPTNPYLNSVTDSLLPAASEIRDVTTPMIVPSAQPPLPAISPVTPTPSPENTPGRVPLAETFRQADDAKHFKQLKRF